MRKIMKAQTLQTLQKAQTLQVDVFVDGCAVESVEAVKGAAIAPYQTWFQMWLSALDIALSPINTYEVSLRLTDDAEIEQLNTDYRQQAKPTDVLSFAALETDFPGMHAIYELEPLPLGDIIISVETAACQAAKRDHSLIQEIAWLSAHGLLHLIGWDHPDAGSLRRMLDQQAYLLSLVDI